MQAWIEIGQLGGGISLWVEGIQEFEVTAKDFHGRTPVILKRLYLLFKRKVMGSQIYKTLSASLGNLWNLSRATFGLNLAIRHSSFLLGRIWQHQS